MNESFFEERWIVEVESRPACVMCTWPLERAARLDLEQLVAHGRSSSCLANQLASNL